MTRPTLVARPGRPPIDEATAARLERAADAAGAGGTPPSPPGPSRAKPPAPAGAVPRVERKGRLRADGSRVGAGEAARLVVYVPPTLADALALEAFQTRRDRGELVAEALAEWLARRR